jgi:Fic family protein
MYPLSMGAGTERFGRQKWPIVTYEPRDWKPLRPVSSHSLKELGRHPYNAAVVPPIADVEVILEPVTRTVAAEATAAIAAFDAEVGATMVPFEALLLRSESAASSQIEQLTASAKSVLMAEAGDESRANARVIAANTAAMRRAIALADNLSGDAIIEMHRELLAESAPDIVGRWRDQQVWIGGRLTSPHDATFVPPHHSRVQASIDDLVAFVSRSDVAAFEQALLAHAQFETIHPFPDGNGRTGRALLHALLRAKGLAHSATVPISAGLLADTSAYFDALSAYRRGEPDLIVRLGAEATFLAIDNARLLASEVASIQDRWRVAVAHLRADALAHRVIVTLPSSPLIYGRDLEQRFDVSAPTANAAIAALVHAKVLSRANGGLRFRRWIAHDIATALDDFAARSQRRSHPSAPSR